MSTSRLTKKVNRVNNLYPFAKIAYIVFWQNKWNTFKFLQKLVTLCGEAEVHKHAQRIHFYTTQSALTNLWFSTLRGYKPTRQEVNRALYLGAFTPLADDFMDEHGLTFEALLEPNHTDIPPSPLFQLLTNHMHQLSQTLQPFRQYFQLAHQAQNESLEQLNKQRLSQKELIEITRNKGGYYTTLYRCVLQNNMSIAEAKMIFSLGAVLQLINDLFDAWKDNQTKVQTLVNYLQDAFQIEKIFDAWVEEFMFHFSELETEKSRKRQTLQLMMPIISRGRVALHQFKNLQNQYGHFNINDYSRKQLIVDMEKPINLRLSFIFYKDLVNS